MNNLQTLPSIEQLMQTVRAARLISAYGRLLTLDALRSTLDEARARLKADPQAAAPENEFILSESESHLAAWTQPTLQPVINATGVILHTNLGRAPLSKATIAAMSEAAQNYSNLEFDLETGKRGSRLIHAEDILKKLLGVAAAVVVNNNASAVLLVLSALASKKRVVIARSQLIEIGGGFRVPDVMKQSGAKLVEVGTTNKVRLSDYKDELADAALVMHAHRSNFKMIGFTEEPELIKIVDVAHKAGVIVVDDLGSGALLDTAKYGLVHEPTVQESLAAGVDVICFSGDKLLGGPQAGIIVGKAELIAKIKKHPLARAVRADKTCLAGITATLLHYLKDEAEREIPIWKMISAPLAEVKARAEKWARELEAGSVPALSRVEVSANEATVGGGSLPGESFPSYVLSLSVKSPDKFLRRLRQQNPPVIARTGNDKILFDPRTVFLEQDQLLLSALHSLLSELK
ncbi:MAG: L-seryl-tRNA(Sec) selenium transferase [Chloroflexi bacterium]|nr:L-seryl-tRNA(Sec) selenium transferase [Chloroflexota bacterium]MBI3340953.1 L-seryl-tRNA(Sec) selenium transferase [Chloroflexota bacterium]